MIKKEAVAELVEWLEDSDSGKICRDLANGKIPDVQLCLIHPDEFIIAGYLKKLKLILKKSKAKN